MYPQFWTKYFNAGGDRSATRGDRGISRCGGLDFGRGGWVGV